MRHRHAFWQVRRDELPSVSRASRPRMGRILRFRDEESVCSGVDPVYDLCCGVAVTDWSLPGSLRDHSLPSGRRARVWSCVASIIQRTMPSLRCVACTRQNGGVQVALPDRPRQGKARQGKARQGKARQGKARQGKARQGKARQGKARQGKARQGKARQGKARQGKARQGKARQGKATHNNNTQQHTAAHNTLLAYTHATTENYTFALPRTCSSNTLSTCNHP